MLGPHVRGGVFGLLTYAVLIRIGSVTEAAAAPTITSPDEIMWRLNFFPPCSEETW